MRIGSLVAGVATMVLLCGLAQRTAYADPKGEVQQKIKEAMENYDLMDYEAAKKLLNQAIAVAKKAKLDKEPLLAKAYLDLGIVSYAVPDAEGAKVSFASAVQIDPKIQIDAAYKSAEWRSSSRRCASRAAVAQAHPSRAAAAQVRRPQGLQHEPSRPARATRRNRSSSTSATTSRRRRSR
jgi:tetratricopeptide (TPR) repeat protein